MFDRILVPTDGSARADEAIAVARQMAEREGSRLVLLRVEAEREAVEEVVAANAAIEARVSELRGQGINTEARFEYGQAESGIPASALREGATFDSDGAAPSQFAPGFDPAERDTPCDRACPAPVLVWPKVCRRRPTRTARCATRPSSCRSMERGGRARTVAGGRVREALRPAAAGGACVSRHR